MPKPSTPKQAKTMSAIAHGWTPKGSASGIDVNVAKHLHGEGAGEKWGAQHAESKSWASKAKYQRSKGSGKRK